MSFSGDPIIIQDAGVLLSVFPGTPALGYVVLAWVWIGTDPDSYTIERSTDNATWTIVAGAASAAQTAAVNGLDLDTNYFFRVVADLGGTPDESDSISHTWPAIAGPEELFVNVNQTPTASYYITEEYDDGTATWSISGVPGSIGFLDAGASVVLVGSPSDAGRFEATVRVQSVQDETIVQAAKTVIFHVSGPDYAGPFHADQTRTGIIVDALTGAVRTQQFADGFLMLGFGDGFNLHVLLRQSGGFVDSGVTNLRFVVKLPNQRDTAPLVSALEATPTMDTFGTVDAWRVPLAINGPYIERIFDAQNASLAAVSGSDNILCEGQVQWTAGGRTRASATFPVRIRQPLMLR